MRKTLLLVLTFSGVSALSTDFFKEYHYVKSPKTWAEAQKYCRNEYADLATVDNQAGNSRLISAIQDSGKHAWIGLYDSMIRWKWTLGNADFNNKIDFSRWKLGQPDNANSKESCAVMQSDGLWRDEICETERPSVCFYEKTSQYILVNTFMIWHEAENNCKSKYTDLARVRDFSENAKIHQLLSRNAWIGLHRNLWSHWSDRSPATFTNWNESQPDNSGSTMTSCAAINTTTGTWFDADCEEKHESVCHSLIPPKSRFKLRFQSEADLNDPDIQQQILEQLHDKLGSHGLADFKLRWIQTDGQTFHQEQKEKKQGSGN